MFLKNYGSKHLLLYLPIALALMCGRAFFYLVKKRNIIPLTGFILGIIWNILNLRDTLYHRSVIQKFIRKVPDKHLKHVMKRLPLLEIIKRI